MWFGDKIGPIWANSFFFFFGDMVFGLILELRFVLHNVSLEHL